MPRSSVINSYLFWPRTDLKQQNSRDIAPLRLTFYLKTIPTPPLNCVQQTKEKKLQFWLHSRYYLSYKGQSGCLWPKRQIFYSVPPLGLIVNTKKWSFDNTALQKIALCVTVPKQNQTSCNVHGSSKTQGGGFSRSRSPAKFTSLRLRFIRREVPWNSKFFYRCKPISILSKQEETDNCIGQNNNIPWHKRTKNGSTECLHNTR